MNKELQSPFVNKKTSLCFHIADFKQRQSKKAFAIGALICMSTTAMAAIAAPENAYQGGARALIATPTQTQTSSYSSSQDINSLREQLLDKTRELQEYKSNLFRASHPQDQAKITELTQRIAEHEKNKQELIAKIQEYENDLINAKKQMSGLEVSTDALTAFIQNQRAIVEAEKNELTAKIRAYEEDPQLEKERKFNEKLLADLEILKSTIATYETRINDLEHNHQKDLQDALQDAAMLKFELADTRALAEKKEHEIIVSTLNYLTMAIDHAKTLRTSQVSHKTKLNESQQDLSTLKSVIDEIANENLRLQRENDQLVEQSNGGQAVLGKHFAERHVLANKLLEKEEALSAALLYYQGTIAEQTNQLQSLQEQLAKEEAIKLALKHEKDHALSQHDLEKHVLESTASQHSETMTDVLLTYQLAINDYLSELNALQERLTNEEALKQKLLQEKDLLANNHAVEKDVFQTTSTDQQKAIDNHVSELQALKDQLEKEIVERNRLQAEKDQLTAQLELHAHAMETSLSEKDEESTKTLAEHQKIITEHVNELQILKDRLDKEIAESNRLQAEKDQLSTQLDLHAHALESSLSEKEEENAKAIELSQATIAEHLSQIESLKEQLTKEEQARAELQKAHEELSSSHSNTNETIALHQLDKQQLELALQEKEEALKKALSTSEDSVAQYVEQIESLKDKLAIEAESRTALQKAHDELALNHSSSKESLEIALQEKEDTYNTQLAASQETTAECQRQIDGLKEKLIKEETDRKQLQQAYEELSSNHSNVNETVALHQLDKQQLELALQDKEEALKKALSDSEDSVAHYAEQIESLKDKLAIEAESRAALQKAHDELALNHSSSKESLEIALKEKEDAYSNHLAASQEATADCQRQIEDLKEKLIKEETDRKQLQQAHEELSSNHSAIEQKMSQYETERHGLENTLNEKEEALKSALSSTQSSLTEYTFIIEELKSKLANEEANHLQLQQAHEELSSKQSGTEHMLSQHEAEKQSLERRLQEKEEALTQALTSFESSTTEYTALVEALKEKLSNEEVARLQLQQTHEGLSSNFVDIEQKMSQYETAKQTLQRALQEKEEEHNSTLTSLHSSTAEYNSIIETLKEKLANEESSRRQLELSHESLTANNASVQQALSQHIADKQSLESSLQEKEEALAHAQNQSQSSNQEFQQELASLQERLKQQQTLHAVYEAKNEEQVNEINTLKQNIQALSSKQFEDGQHNRNLAEQLSSLSSQIDHDRDMIEHMKQEISKLTTNVSEKTAKENELEQAVHSLTIVAEQQDHALAEANSAFTMVQEYNRHLEAENSNLKSRLDQLETAERSVRRNSESSESNDQSFISPALIQLLRPKS